MRESQQAAMRAVRMKAMESCAADAAYVRRICRTVGVDEEVLTARMLQRPVTLNFHPDRWAANGKTVLEGLLEDGRYRGQFETGTTNGGRGTEVGGQRYEWERDLFSGAYPEEDFDRPKYGALNLLRSLDGGAPRFGSCFLVLRPEIADRCTFCCGDSSAKPRALCTADTIVCLAAELLRGAKREGRILWKSTASAAEALAILLDAGEELKYLSRSLDDYIEVHIHGEVSLQTDVAALYMDGSYRGTVYEQTAGDLCGRYEMELRWIPRREVPAGEIGPLFRGEAVQRLAGKVASLFGDGTGMIDAWVIGQAVLDARRYPENWTDFGDEVRQFRYFKQLWHTVACFG